MKKTIKKSAKKSAARESNLAYAFLKVPSDAAGEETIQGCVLAGIRKIKRGSLDDVTEAATKAGLNKVSDQDLRNQTRIHLRRLANKGAVRITRNGEESKTAKKKTSKKAKKSFKLVKK